MKPVLCLILLMVPSLAGCDQKMADQPRYDPLEKSSQFSDGMSARTPVPGTVPRDADLAPIKQAIPTPVTMEQLQRGRERFEIFCAPCHGRSGDGHGVVVRHGFPAPPSYHQDALRQAPDRHFYDVITNGYGAMYSYAARVPPADRWAIVAYIRALQVSRTVPVASLPADLRTRLQAEPSP